MSINQSLAHGLNVLFLYDVSRPLLMVAEISERLGFGQSKTYRLVRTFVEYGLLQVSPGTAQYSLGSNALRLGLLAQQQFNIAVIAKPFMKELSGMFNHSRSNIKEMESQGFEAKRPPG